MMVTTKPTATIEEATAAAVNALVSVRVWGEAVFVDLPLFHPSGAAATVKIQPHGGSLLVSDGGFAYREAEMIGAERMFRRVAEEQAAEIGGNATNRALSIIATESTLAGAIADIANASARISSQIAKKAGARGEAEIIDFLYKRLVSVFGGLHVKAQVPLLGPSTKEWLADAVVNFEDRRAVFQAVTRHHASVYSTSAMFHDIALRDDAPITIAVVRDKQELGAFLGILSQAGHVIEESQPDKVFRAAVDLLRPI